MSTNKPGRLYLLTKSKFMAGRQCLKRAYLEVNHPEQATPTDEARQAIFDRGHLVGRMAHERYPGGVLVDVDRSHPQEALRQTAILLRDPAILAIFEGAFLFDDILVRADIVTRQPDGTWHLLECKSSTKVKPEHHWDVAVQAYVLKGAGIPLTRSWLMHLNPAYVHHGGPRIDVNRFMVLTEVTGHVDALHRQMAREITMMKRAVLAPDPPPIEPGSHCHEPYRCAFWAHCTRRKPSRWIGHLPDGGKQISKLVARGIQTIDDILRDFPLSPIQRAAWYDVEWLAPGFTSTLQRIHHPIHHLHIEAGSYGIPLYSGMRPYEPLPFQWTDLIESEIGEIRVEEWVSVERPDPRVAFTEMLLHALGSEGSIVVYSDFVAHALDALATALPPHREALKTLSKRIVDLRHLIRKAYYHPTLNPAVYNHEAFPRASSIQDFVSGLSTPERYQLLTNVDDGWSSRQYHRVLQPTARQGACEAFRRDVCARSRQAVQALSDIRLYLAARASSWDEVRAREDAA